MLLDICLGTRSAWKILLLMSESPGKVLTRKQIMKYTYMGNKVLVKFINTLVLFDVIQEMKRGRKHFYRLNSANPFTKKILDVIELERRQLNALYFGDALILREFVYELTNLDFDKVKKVILFGSVAKHTASVHSDIDVALIVTEPLGGSELLHAEAIGRLKKRFGREIQVHYFTENEFENGLKNGQKLITEIAADGIVLVG